MIMEKANSSRDLDRNNANKENIPESFMQEVLNSINDIVKRLGIKDKEIGELQEKLNIAETTINRLQRRISTLEENRQQQASGGADAVRRNSEAFPSHHHQQQPTLLLLGDENLSKISPRDLNNGCSIRTINGSNIDLLKCWLSDQLNWIPQKCILYGGMNDILDGVSPNVILDNLGALVSTLKEKNEFVEIYVCELVTIFNAREFETKIKDYNKKMIEWSSDNNINIIKTDEMCFEFGEEIKDRVLNRYGVIRLLDTIVKQYPDIERSINIGKIKRKNLNRDYQKPKMQIRDNQIDRYKHNQWQNNHHQNSYRPNNLNNFHQSFDYDDRDSRFDNRFSLQRRRYEQVDTYSRYSDRIRGCYNCGERNHQQISCRYNNRVQCENCWGYGHKRRLCQMHQSR